MLSRTADNLFWLSRYIERAEFLARILEATQRLADLPQSYGGGTNEWSSALASAGCLNQFLATGQEPTQTSVTEFLAFSPDNASSIRSCLEVARTNARAVRTALTVEMWEAINGGWLESRKSKVKPDDRDSVGRFLDIAKQASLSFDGSAYRTMLRNDAYYFARIGSYMERADNTARILDVKYHVLLPPTEAVGGPLDYFQWASILRSVSALTAYHWVYRENLKPWHVADFLILNQQMPRSLAACYSNLVRYLDELAVAYGRQGKTQRHARQIAGRLENLRIDDVFQGGLHEFVSDVIADNNQLGQDLAEQYLL
jgi:uncharacterized alpha-E superfamily protein